MKKAFLILLLSPIFFVCKKDECKNHDKGIISEVITPGCILQLPKTGVVIHNDSIYSSLFDPKDSTTCNLPNIDFKQNTLLGMFASASGSNASFQFQVLRDDPNKKYVYTIFSCDKGMDKILAISNNLVVVPKLPDGYQVDFIEK